MATGNGTSPTMRTPVVLIVAAAALTLSGCGGNASGMDQTARDFMAYDACKDAVSAQLKAPSTADFQGNTDVDYRTTGGNNITVIGWVDSENSFGAKLRSSWTCSTDVDSSGQASNTTATVTG